MAKKSVNNVNDWFDLFIPYFELVYDYFENNPLKSIGIIIFVAFFIFYMVLIR